MKKIWSTIVGLIFDDWWLFSGILAGILLAYLGLQSGINPVLGGWIWLVLAVLALVLSLSAELKKEIR